MPFPPRFSNLPQRVAGSFRSHGSPCGRRGAHTPLGLESLEPRIALAGEGLTAQYFHNVDFTGLAAERTEAVNFAWISGTPVAGMVPNSFSVRWMGQVEAEFSETYTFQTMSDDGVRLWVDGRLLIDNWTSHTLETDSATIALTAGQRYDVRLEYYDNLGTAEIRLQWQSASQPLEAIPASQLYASPSGVWGEYSDNFGGKGTRLDPGLSFNWGTSRPISTVAVDNFQARWTGYIRPEFSGEYTFATHSDEGVRVWIGDELVIDHWTPHAAATLTGVKTLEAGKWYDVRVEYFDGSGSAELQLTWASEHQTGGELAPIPAANLRAAKHAPLMAANPLGRGQDPFVIRWQDKYLHVHSRGNSVWITGADELQDVQRDDPDARSIRAWTAPTGTNYSGEIWAPELHQLNGKWYIYVAASDGNNATHRMHVLERDDPNPMGPFTYKGQLAATTDRWAIDGTVLEWQGQHYFVWSGWAGFSNGQQNLYIARMLNPWTISGERVLLAEPTLSWERHGMPINEGPQILINNGQLHIIYSGSGYWVPQYALGRLTYNGTGSIMSRSSWTKTTTPVFQSTSEVVGVGHASFTESPDGTEHWIVYHAHPEPGGDADARVIRIQQFTFNANGTPNFGAPLPADSHVEVPSGVADPDRPPLVGDFDASGVVNVADLATFRAQYGVEKFPGRIVDGADFLAWQRQLGATATAATALVAGTVSAEVASESAYQRSAPAPSSSNTAAPAFISLDVMAGRLTGSPFAPVTSDRSTLANQSLQRRDETIDDAFARWSNFHPALAARAFPLDAARRDSALDDALWADDDRASSDYRIGAAGAWLMSTGAGKSVLGRSFGSSLGDSLAIEPASP